MLITGASSGIGAALALEYARTGAHLSLCARTQQTLATVAQACREAGAASVTATVLDVTDRERTEAWVRQVDAEHPLDLVVANAGISAGTLGAGVSPERATHRMWDTNVMGCLNVVLPVLPRMEAAGRGHLVAVSSLASYFPMPLSPAYAASKAGLRMMFECLRQKYRGRVDFSVVCPGFVKTGMTGALNAVPCLVRSSCVRLATPVLFDLVQQKSLPFEITVEDAARRIRRGIDNNDAVIAFPWLAYFFVWSLSSMPPAIQDALHGGFQLLSAGYQKVFGSKRKDE